MARIPEGEVERLKREVSVVRLAEARGIKLRRQGSDLLGLCPFHPDRTPSLVITPAKNLWHCPGGVRDGQHGDRLGDAGRERELPACSRAVRNSKKISGWASPTGRLATAWKRRTGRAVGAVRGRLRELGVYRESGHEHFDGSPNDDALELGTPRQHMALINQGRPGDLACVLEAKAWSNR